MDIGARGIEMGVVLRIEGVHPVSPILSNWSATMVVTSRKGSSLSCQFGGPVAVPARSPFDPAVLPDIPHGERQDDGIAPFAFTSAIIFLMYHPKVCTTSCFLVSTFSISFVSVPSPGRVPVRAEEEEARR